ncbi:CynX/NimT family MFS transporter [Salinimicrobium sediminilitoris]|uniref:CynX/NimT family MFS transporter n=1 Tax=Salinimicrobium sediminilitoris TaxID=2876715 RepID=UPI001E507082|nr:MFS transporter [Salinimicrobium sediminilitoris]MCC8360420.1 MFS transporter [Salinimicrobium sediminilitoris]
MYNPNSELLTKRARIWLLTGILFIAMNLRPALSGIGPLVDHIRQAFNLSDTLLGLLTTLPLLAFGVISTITPLFTKRFGIGKTILGAMALLVVGILIRSWSNIAGLYLGTTLLGIAISFGNVLIPALTKQNFPHKAGFITSLYSATMSIGASLAAGLSVPLAADLNLGWQGSLASWSLLAFAAFVIWIPQIKRIKRNKPRRSFKTAMKKLSGTQLVWQLALFMGLQSLTFYVLLAWLPDILISRGYDTEFAGWMLSLSQATGIIGALIVPSWAGSRKDQRLVIALLVFLEIIGLVGLMLPQLGLVVVWVSILGLVLGGTFGLALLLLVLRSSDSETAAELSGIVQSIGYFIAAIGPFLVGLIQDSFKIWNYSLGLLVIISLLKLWVGMGAGRAQKL